MQNNIRQAVQYDNNELVISEVVQKAIREGLLPAQNPAAVFFLPTGIPANARWPLTKRRGSLPNALYLTLTSKQNKRSDMR